MIKQKVIGNRYSVFSNQNLGETLCLGALVAKKRRTPERCKSKKPCKFRDPDSYRDRELCGEKK